MILDDGQSIGVVGPGWVWVLLKIGIGSDDHRNKPETKLNTHIVWETIDLVSQF